MLILHDIPHNEMITGKYLIQPEPKLKKIQADENRYTSLSTMLREMSEPKESIDRLCFIRLAFGPVRQLANMYSAAANHRRDYISINWAIVTKKILVFVEQGCNHTCSAILREGQLAMSAT
ncbi:hypothetical protein V2G26_000374 [Clonostachys chloroleuca]